MSFREIVFSERPVSTFDRSMTIAFVLHLQ
jgi:hypothetical protein